MSYAQFEFSWFNLKAGEIAGDCITGEPHTQRFVSQRYPETSETRPSDVIPAPRNNRGISRLLPRRPTTFPNVDFRTSVTSAIHSADFDVSDSMTRVSRVRPVARRIYRAMATSAVAEGVRGRQKRATCGGQRETRIVPSLRSQPGGGLDREMV